MMASVSPRRDRYPVQPSNRRRQSSRKKSREDTTFKEHLRRVYGWYWCRNCNKPWESAYTWCSVSRGFWRVRFQQDCKSCYCSTFPYEIDAIRCQVCEVKPCVCLNKRHSDERKSHIQALCHKCKDQAEPCSSFRHQTNDYADGDYQAFWEYDDDAGYQLQSGEFREGHDNNKYYQWQYDQEEFYDDPYRQDRYYQHGLYYDDRYQGGPPYDYYEWTEESSDYFY